MDAITSSMADMHARVWTIRLQFCDPTLSGDSQFSMRIHENHMDRVVPHHSYYNTCIFRMSIRRLTHYNLLCNIMSLQVSLLTIALYLFYILPLPKSIIVHNFIFFRVTYSIYTTFSQSNMWMTSFFFVFVTFQHHFYAITIPL